MQPKAWDTCISAHMSQSGRFVRFPEQTFKVGRQNLPPSQPTSPPAQRHFRRGLKRTRTDCHGQIGRGPRLFSRSPLSAGPPTRPVFRARHKWRSEHGSLHANLLWRRHLRQKQAAIVRGPRFDRSRASLPIVALANAPRQEAEERPDRTSETSPGRQLPRPIRVGPALPKDCPMAPSPRPAGALSAAVAGPATGSAAASLAR